MFERFAGNRRRSGDGEFVEVTPYMRPAERKPDVAALGQLAVAGIAVDLQDALEAVEMGDQTLMQRAQVPGGVTDPIRQR